MDIAASIQAVTEEVMIKMARHAKEITGLENLCLSGGVALNCVGNGKLLKEKIFKNIWIQPAAGDAGSALGAAQFLWHQLLDNKRKASTSDSMKGSLIGNSFSNKEIKKYLDTEAVQYTFFEGERTGSGKH